MTDVVIIGSGPGGVNAAYPLCEAGLNVKMIDFGNTDYKYRPLVPEKDFLRIRLSDTQQHRYFLGDEFEGILLGNIRVGTKLTPPRLHVLADTAELMPVDSNTFIANESLALGGLADSWGAGVFPFREEDFSDMPISLADLMPHYKIVAERIGISGGRDDLYPFFGEYETMMPPLCIDSNAEKILNKYHQKRQLFNKQGYYLGRAPLAVCTEPHKERNPHQYHDMDFWADTDNSVYRPRYTLNELRRYSNFSYIRNRFVQSFREREDSSVEITAQVKNSSKIENHTARTLVIAAGAISSARIVIRSLKEYGSHIPILTNSYTYYPFN